MHDRWKVLAPVDLGSEAEAHVQHALNAAEAVKGDLTMLYVLDGRIRHAEGFEWPANAMAAHRNSAVRRLPVVGSVADTVGRYANDVGADLITVTVGSNRWWNRVWRKSTAAAIARATDRPIYLTDRSAPPLSSAFKSFLCVVALDGTDDPLVRFSEELAQRYDATLVLLHVLPEVNEGLMAYGLLAADDRPLSREVAERRLKELTAGLYCPNLTAITTGSAYRAIEKLRREHEADAVITGRRDGAVSDLDPGVLLSRVPGPVISVRTGSHVLLDSGVLYGRQRAAAIDHRVAVGI